MQSLKERFLERFIALEKLCNDMFGCQNGVTKYIDQLKARSDCEAEKSSWYNFYKKLVKCRTARNALVHPDDYVFVDENDIQFLDKLYQDILNRRDPLCYMPKLYTVSFYADDKLVAKVSFKEGTRRISEPQVPPKQGNDGKWESYTLGNKDLVVHAKYTPKTHNVSFCVEGKFVGTVLFKEGDRRISEPVIPSKDGYDGKWESYTLGDKDLVVRAVYTPKRYKVSFYADNDLITISYFQYGASKILEPLVPPKPGYDGKWESYTLGDKDLVVRAVYTKKINSRTSTSGAQAERDLFWYCFDKYLAQQDEPFYVTHEKGGKNQAAGNINNPSPMAMQTICCEYRYRDREIWVLVFIDHMVELYDYLYARKDKIEKELGYKIDWMGQGPRVESVRIIKKSFPINNQSYDEMVREVFPYILDFIRVFEPYLKAFVK